MSDSQIFGLVLLGTLLVLAIILVVVRRRSRWLRENGVHTTGEVLDTEYRRNSEGGGAWFSQVRFTDSEDIERVRWLGGRYEGQVEIVHHPRRWKRAMIVGGTVVDTRPRLVRKIAVGFLVVMFAAWLGAGVLLSTTLWAPRLGDPDMAAICEGSGSSQHTALEEGQIPHRVVGVDVDSERVVDIGLPHAMEWDSRADLWDAELVLCLDRVRREFVSTCRYTERSLALYDSHYDVTLREAHSGEVLATERWTADVDRRCPIVATFRNSDINPKPRYSTELVGIIDFLRPHVNT